MRHLLRPLRQTAGRRFNSSSAGSSSNPQMQKAVDGAQRAYAQTATTMKKVAGPIGDRVGNALGGYREPLVYNGKVFTSLLRQVYQAERMAPPLELSQWASAYSQIFSRGVSASWWRETLRSGSWAIVGIVALEAYGIFCIGEMIGRRNLVGYKLHE